MRRRCGRLSRYERVLDTRIVLKNSGSGADAIDQHKTSVHPALLDLVLSQKLGRTSTR
jgi:hypothetical protein